MKKFYLLTLVLSSVLSQGAFSQVHTAIFSGNWSDASIWGVNGIPSNPCNNCTITINDGVFVTLDISFKMTGTSKMFVGSAGAFASGLLIPTTNATNLSSGHNITLSNVGGFNPTIKIVSAFSSITFTQLPGTSGKYDGVLVQNASDNTYLKIVGIKPTLISSDGSTVPAFDFLLPPPVYGTSLPNGAHPAPLLLNSDGALPVVLLSFDAVLIKDQVQLTWSTSLELNSDHFTIQHSNDAVKWTNLGQVKAQGNSGVVVNYSFIDPLPSAGKVNFYRMQMVDIDGKFKYSPVKAVGGVAIQGFRIFPNPAKDYINVTISADAAEELVFRLFNSSGQIMQEKKFGHAAGTIVSLPITNYPQGSYILSISDSKGKKEVNKILIAR